jgi:ketosteroid isomerase-like protein
MTARDFVGGPRLRQATTSGARDNAAVSEESAEVVRRMIDAFNRGDLAEALAECAPEVEWHTSGQFADQGVYRGHAGIEELQAELTEELEELSYSTSELQAAGDSAFVAGTLRGRGRRSGAAFEQPFWYSVALSDGQIVSVVTHLARERALEASGIPR